MVNKMVTMELRPQEAELIKRIREKYRYGEIVIKTQDGLPIKIIKTREYENLADSFEV